MSCWTLLARDVSITENGTLTLVGVFYFWVVLKGVLHKINEMYTKGKPERLICEQEEAG